MTFFESLKQYALKSSGFRIDSPKYMRKEKNNFQFEN